MKLLESAIFERMKVTRKSDGASVSSRSLATSYEYKESPSGASRNHEVRQVNSRTQVKSLSNSGSAKGISVKNEQTFAVPKTAGKAKNVKKVR
jgi:hypothetical protein